MLCWDSPIDTKGFIKDRDTTISLWVIEVITLVLEDCCLRKDCEAMGKALRNEELAMIVFCQFYGYMLAISRRAFSNIHCYIEHSTFYATYQLALCVRRTLEVQASHYAIATHGLVVLAEVNTMPQDRRNLIFKLSLAEALEEVATSITEEAWLYNENAFNICFNYIHCFTYVLEIGISKIMSSFFTIKEGSTFLTKPLFPQEREDVTALRC